MAICGYYGFGNAGDELILAGILQGLRSLRPGLAATVVSGDPVSTRASHGVDAVHWQDVPAIVAGVRDADLVVVGGGGLFQEYAGIDRDSLFSPQHYAITFYAEPAILGALCGRPVMLYAIGVGPLVSEHGRRTVRAACEAARVVTVRDEESARLVASLGVDPARVRVTADPVFALATAGGAGAQERLVDALLPGAGTLVGVSLRPWDVGVASYFWEKEVAAGLDAFLAAHDARLLFVPFQGLDRASENDARVAERVRALLRHPERAAVLPGDPDPNLLAAVLGSCDLVVGMRLHATILAAVSGVPCVALSYDPKVELSMRQVGAERFVVPLPDIEGRTVARLMEEALAGKEARRRELRERVDRLAQLARSDAVAAVELLDRGPAPPTLSPTLSEVVTRAVTARFEVEAALREEIARAGAAAADRERARTAAEAAREEAAAELRREREELSRRDGELAEARSATERRGAELQQLRADLEARAEELRRLRADLEARTAEVRQLRSDLEARAEELRRLRADLEAETAELERTEAELSVQDEALERAHAGEARLRDRVAELDDELSRIHRSRLWKVATRYWRFLELIGRLPGRKG